MGILTKHNHEFWATISGRSVQEVVAQQDATWKWGVTAVELRADLMTEDSFEAALARSNQWQGPTFVAHFGVGREAEVAYQTIDKAVKTGAYGGICHSRCELARDIQRACVRTNRSFAAAYHSQQPMTLAEADREFEEQAALQPLFRKIAVRAQSFEDALAIVQATHRASRDGGSPVVGAVFGPQRWARVALPHAGSSISFLIAHRVPNEVGGDDEQLQIMEADLLQRVRGVYPSEKGESVKQEYAEAGVAVR